MIRDTCRMVRMVPVLKSLASAATGSNRQNCDALSGRDQTGWRRNRASLAASSPAAASGESLSLKMLFPALAII